MNYRILGEYAIKNEKDIILIPDGEGYSFIQEGENYVGWLIPDDDNNENTLKALKEQIPDYDWDWDFMHNEDENLWWKQFRGEKK